MQIHGELSSNLSIVSMYVKGVDSPDKWRRKMREGTACDAKSDERSMLAHLSKGNVVMTSRTADIA